MNEVTLAEYDAVVAELDRLPLAYLHLRGPDPAAEPDFAAFARFRRRFRGPLIVNNGFDGGSANAIVGSAAADAVSFAKHFIANPDLVTRLALGRELTAGDPRTYYAGGASGYVDYPLGGGWPA